jgi:hypothetical protein
MYAFQMDVPQPVDMYDRVSAALNESGNAQPAERLMHMCAATDTGFRVTEVWQSHEACDRYGDEVLRPTIDRVAGPEMTAGGPPPNQELDVRALQLGTERVNA